MPGINRITCCPDERLWKVMIEVIAKTSGISPSGKGHTPGVKRAYYADAMSRGIINTSSREIQERLGFPAAIDAIEVDDPTDAALTAGAILLGYGYDFKLVDDLETGMKKGSWSS